MEILEEKKLRIITSDTNDKFESRIITGQTSSATATVDSVQNFQSGALTVTELYLTNIVGTFVVGENITSSEFEGTTGSGTAQGVITNINITSAGTNYKVLILLQLLVVVDKMERLEYLK